MRMRFGSAEAMAVAARSVSRALCRETLTGSTARLKPASPVSATTAPTRLRAVVQRLARTDGLQRTIICCGAMTCGSPSITCVTVGVARAGAASASANRIAAILQVGAIGPLLSKGEAKILTLEISATCERFQAARLRRCGGG